MGIKDFLGLNKKNNREKEETMKKSYYQGQREAENNVNSGLDYELVMKAKERELKRKLDTFRDEFNKLDKEKQQAELKGEKFKKLSEKIKKTKKPDLIKRIEEMENKKEKSDFEKLSEKLIEIKSKLERIENENLLEQGKNINDIAYSIEDITKIIDRNFFNNIKRNIKFPEIDLYPIKRDINDIKTKIENLKKIELGDINNSNQTINKNIKTLAKNLEHLYKKLSDSIENIKLPTPPKIPTDYLKEDDYIFYNNQLKKDLNEIKEINETLEVIPAKVNKIEKDIQNLSEKIDNVSSSKKEVEVNIPKEEKAVIELAQYMKDGISQFEGIAKEYISKISELENLEKIKTQHKEELEKSKEIAFDNGKQKGKIELIKQIAEKFPTSFKNIKSLFEEFITEKFEKDEIIEINDENKNEVVNFIEKIDGNGKYRVISPAILLRLNREILFKAEVEKEEIKKDDEIVKEEESSENIGTSKDNNDNNNEILSNKKEEKEEKEIKEEIKEEVEKNQESLKDDNNEITNKEE